MPIIIENIKWNTAQRYEWTGHVEHGLGNYKRAEESLLKSLRYAREVADPYRITFTLVGLGDLYTGMSLLERAQEVYQEAVRLAKSSSQYWQEAWALRGLGQVGYGRGDYQDATGYAEKSLNLCQTIGWKYGRVQNYNLLGLLAVAQNNLSAARQYFHKSLASGLVTETPPLILATLYGMSHLAASEGNLERAVELLSLIRSHSKSHADTKHVAQALLDELQAKLAQDLFEAAGALGQHHNLVNIVEGLLMELAGHIGQAPRQTPAELTEPLTRTELKILRLMDSHFSYPEIAEQRSVSLNTIKTHRSNIYSKLGVGSRQEAVERAKDLALL